MTAKILYLAWCQGDFSLVLKMDKESAHLGIN